MNSAANPGGSDHSLSHGDVDNQFKGAERPQLFGTYEAEVSEETKGKSVTAQCLKGKMGERVSKRQISVILRTGANENYYAENLHFPDSGCSWEHGFKNLVRIFR